MKYYGIKKQVQRENFLYSYAKARARVKGVIPGKHRNHFKSVFKYSFCGDDVFAKYSNAIPTERFIKLDQIVVSDLILRENTEELKAGIKALLRKYRAGNRFIGLPIDSLEDICTRIDSMDSTLLSWYEQLDCGLFAFRNKPISSLIDYFSLGIRNVNSSFLSVEFRLFLAEGKRKELERLIESDHHEARGFARKILSSKKEGGAFDTYTVVHYSGEALKADRVFEWISRIEWEFLNEVNKSLPLLLHGRNIMPPRIEVYYTDIDYHEDNRSFWASVGVSDYQGQFIDTRHKLFFNTGHTERYSDEQMHSRFIYIVKDDGVEAGQFQSVRSTIYYHIDEYAMHYFRFMFLRIISSQAGRITIKYKRLLDGIKLNKNKLSKLLRLRYRFEKEIDIYTRYAREDVWKKSINVLANEVYSESDAVLKKIKYPFVTTYHGYAKGALSGAKRIDDVVDVLQKDFSDKEQVLQHLSDYKNSTKNWWLNVIMLIITAITLLFVVFPEWTARVSEAIRCIWHWIIRAFKI